MGKILLIEKDIQTITAISLLLATLGHEILVIHNWPSRVKTLENERPLAVIVDVEMHSVHVDKLADSFPQNTKESIPLFFLYSRTFSPKFVNAQEYPHSGTLKKPIHLDELYSLLEKKIEFKDIPEDESDYPFKLVSYKKIEREYTEWVDQLNSLLGNRSSR